jgi:hypothetical protein
MAQSATKSPAQGETSGASYVEVCVLRWRLSESHVNSEPFPLATLRSLNVSNTKSFEPLGARGSRALLLLVFGSSGCAGDPSLHDLDAGRIERNHVGAVSWQKAAQGVTEAEKLRRMRRGEAQCIGER